MNTARSPRTTASRAQLSPLSRRSVTGSPVHGTSTLAGLLRHSRRHLAAGSAQRAAELLALGTLWSSTFLDRLQPAITRYHD